MEDGKEHLHCSSSLQQHGKSERKLSKQKANKFFLDVAMDTGTITEDYFLEIV